SHDHDYFTGRTGAAADGDECAGCFNRGWGDAGLSGDGFVATHTIVMGTVFTNSRAFLYKDMGRQLGEERMNLDGTHRWTNTFTLDGGQAGKAGVITKVGQASSLSPTWSAALDSFSRVTTETNTTVRRPALGTNNGL